MERRAQVGGVAAVVGRPAVFDRRETDRLGVGECQALDKVRGAHAEAREQQIGEPARIAKLIGLVVHESRVHHFVMVIVVLVTADRKIRDIRLRQATPVSDFLRRRGVADIAALPYEQRVLDP